MLRNEDSNHVRCLSELDHRLAVRTQRIVDGDVARSAYVRLEHYARKVLYTTHPSIAPIGDQQYDQSVLAFLILADLGDVSSID